MNYIDLKNQPTKLNTRHIHMIKEKIEDCFRKAEKFYTKKFDRPYIEFFDKVRTCGYATKSRGHDTPIYIIGIHETFFLENMDDMLSDTVPHEVSHLLVMMIYGRVKRPHGIEWQRTMKYIMNVDPKRTHDYNMDNVPVRRQRLLTYSCECREVQFSATTHHRIAKGDQAFTCGKCKTKFKRGSSKVES